MGVDPTVCQAAGASAPASPDIVKPGLRGNCLDIEARFDYVTVTSPAEIL